MQDEVGPKKRTVQDADEGKGANAEAGSEAKAAFIRRRASSPVEREPEQRQNSKDQTGPSEAID